MLRKHEPGRACCCGLCISAVCFRVLCVESQPEVLEPECENAIRVRAVVTKVYRGAAANVGDEIVIWDPRHAHFDIGIEDLIGAVGTAVYETNAMESDWGTIDSGCDEYSILEALYCRWVVTAIKPCDDECSGLAKDEIVFRVVSNAPIMRTEPYEDLDFGLRVRAEVIESACATDVVSLWDHIIVWDLDFDTFDLPIQVLLGAIGTARHVDNPLEDPDCDEYTNLGSADCRWIVTGLVCAEELYACG